MSNELDKKDMKIYALTFKNEDAKGIEVLFALDEAAQRNAETGAQAIEAAEGWGKYRVLRDMGALRQDALIGGVRVPAIRYLDADGGATDARSYMNDEFSGVLSAVELADLNAKQNPVEESDLSFRLLPDAVPAVSVETVVVPGKTVNTNKNGKVKTAAAVTVGMLGATAALFFALHKTPQDGEIGIPVPLPSAPTAEGPKAILPPKTEEKSVRAAATAPSAPSVPSVPAAAPASPASSGSVVKNNAPKRALKTPPVTIPSVPTAAVPAMAGPVASATKTPQGPVTADPNPPASPDQDVKTSTLEFYEGQGKKVEIIVAWDEATRKKVEASAQEIKAAHGWDRHFLLSAKGVKTLQAERFDVTIAGGKEVGKKRTQLDQYYANGAIKLSQSFDAETGNMTQFIDLRGEIPVEHRFDKATGSLIYQAFYDDQSLEKRRNGPNGEPPERWFVDKKDPRRSLAESSLRR